MTKDLEAEVQALRTEVRALAQAVAALKPAPPAGLTAPTPAAQDQSVEEFRRRCPEVVKLEQMAQEKGTPGYLTHYGYYSSGHRTAMWCTEARSAQELLALDDDLVAKVLGALGNKQRLGILKAILQEPASAAELVDRLGMGTTGQVYHHLKALQAAALITQEERGRYVIYGHRVQSLLMLLAGVYDMVDSRHVTGTWDQAE